MATTYYVSDKVGPAPYVVGNNANNGLSPTTPFLTLDQGLTTALAGDTILVNSAAALPTLTFFNVARGVIIRAVTPGTPLQGLSGQARVIAASASSGSITIDGFYIDARSLSSFCVTFGGSSVANLLLKNCTVANPATSAHVSDATNVSAGISMQDCIFVGNATTGGLVVSQAGAGKRVTVKRCSGKVGGITASRGGAIALTATASGATARITQCDGLWAESNNTGALVAPIHTMGFVANIENNKNMVVTQAIANCTGSLIAVEPPTAGGFTCANGIIRKNSGYNYCANGYLQRVGTDNDSTSATDNLANNWVSSGNKYWGNPLSTAMHGFMFGNCLGGISTNDEARNVSISFLSKMQTTGATFLGFRSYEANSGNCICYSKGSVGVTFQGGEIHLPAGYVGNSIRVDSNPTTSTNSTGCVVKSNNIYSADPAGVTLLVTVPGANSATFDDNNYFLTIAAGAHPFEYNGTTYDTVPLWAAAHEATARTDTPTELDDTFHREAYMPLIRSELMKNYPHLLNLTGLQQ